MRILVLGSGAREHAIMTALLREDAGHEIVVAPGNAGIAAQVEVVHLDPSNGAVVTEYALENDVHLVVVGPEAPLVAGVADSLRSRGIPVFGPGKKAAALEGSKTFAKRVMEAAGVPTGRATRVGTLDEAVAVLDDFGSPYVVKADGLAVGEHLQQPADGHGDHRARGRGAGRDRGARLAHRRGALVVVDPRPGHAVTLLATARRPPPPPGATRSPGLRTAFPQPAARERRTGTR